MKIVDVTRENEDTYFQCLEVGSEGIAEAGDHKVNWYRKAAELGFIDEVILPQDTRPRLISALTVLREKKVSIPGRRHGNCPL